MRLTDNQNLVKNVFTFTGKLDNKFGRVLNNAFWRDDWKLDKYFALFVSESLERIDVQLYKALGGPL